MNILNGLFGVSKIYKSKLEMNYFFKFFIPLLIISIISRLHYLFRKAGDLDKANLGGDPCNHFNIANNVSKGIGPYTDYIIHYWFYHPSIPAMSDVYMPGFHFFLGIFLYLFGETYFVGRIFNFFISLVTIYISYIIGKKIHSKTLGILSAAITSFNIFHIENSTVVMSPMFTLLVMQIGLLFLIISISSSKYWYITGFVSGLIYLTTNAGIGFLITGICILTYNIFQKTNLQNLMNIFFYLISFTLILIPWGIISYNYFGEAFYSNLKYYPFTDNFSEMMYNTSPPDIGEFFNEYSILFLLKKYLIFLFKDLIKLSLYLTPTPIFFISFLSLPIILLGVLKTKFESKFLKFTLIFPATVYFLSIILGSSALGGQLWPRHFIPLLCFFSPLYAIALLYLYHFLKKRFDIALKNFINFKKYNYIFIIFIYFSFGTASIIANEIKSSFWERPSTEFYKFGEWVKNYTDTEDVIMFALTPSDAWCATDRNIVGDTVFAFDKSKNLAKDQIIKYNVKYIWFNFSDDIYSRSQYRERFSDFEKLYEGINLKLIHVDDNKNNYFYKVVK